jgi:hypothetical protein
MVSVPAAVKAEIGGGGSGKTDYRHREGLSFLNGIELAQAYPDLTQHAPLHRAGDKESMP